MFIRIGKRHEAIQRMELRLVDAPGGPLGRMIQATPDTPATRNLQRSVDIRLAPGKCDPPAARMPPAIKWAVAAQSRMPPRIGVERMLRLWCLDAVLVNWRRDFPRLILNLLAMVFSPEKVSPGTALSSSRCARPRAYSRAIVFSYR